MVISLRLTLPAQRYSEEQRAYGCEEAMQHFRETPRSFGCREANLDREAAAKCS